MRRWKQTGPGAPVRSQEAPGFSGFPDKMEDGRGMGRAWMDSSDDFRSPFIGMPTMRHFFWRGLEGGRCFEGTGKRIFQ